MIGTAASASPQGMREARAEWAAQELETDLSGAARAPVSLVAKREAAGARRATALAGVFSLLVMVGAGGATLAGRARVAADQIRSTQVRQAVAAAAQQRSELRLEVAQLSAPSRIVGLAEHRLGMVVPGHVTYLQPLPARPRGR